MGGTSPLKDVSLLNYEYLHYFLLILLVFAIVWERCLRFVELRLRHFPNFLKILSRCYKELMVLGFISFSIVIIEQLYHLSSEALLTLEFAHLWLFFIALSYILHIFLYMMFSEAEKRRFDQARLVSAQEIVHQWRDSRTTHSSSFHSWLDFRLSLAWFLPLHSLPNDFDFAKYLRKCTSKFVTKQLEIDESNWLIILLLIAADLGRMKIMQLADGQFEEIQYHYGTDSLWTFLALAWILLALNVAVLVVLIGARRRLIRSLSVGYSTAIEALAAVCDCQLNNRTRRSARVSSDDNNTGGHPVRFSAIASSSEALVRSSSSHFAVSLSGIFPFDRPDWIARSLQLLTMSQNFLLALTFVLHIRQSLNLLPLSTAAFYICLALLPQLLILLLVHPKCISIYVFLHSTVYGNRKLVAETLQSTSETEELRRECGAKLESNRLSKGITRKSFLAKLCRESWGKQEKQQIQEENKNNADHEAVRGRKVSVSEWTFLVSGLRSALESEGIFLTQKQTHRLTRAIQQHRDGKLTLQELAEAFALDQPPLDARRSSVGLLRIEGKEQECDLSTVELNPFFRFATADADRSISRERKEKTRANSADQTDRLMKRYPIKPERPSAVQHVTEQFKPPRRLSTIQSPRSINIDSSPPSLDLGLSTQEISIVVHSPSEARLAEPSQAMN